MVKSAAAMGSLLVARLLLDGADFGNGSESGSSGRSMTIQVPQFLPVLKSLYRERKHHIPIPRLLSLLLVVASLAHQSHSS